MPRVSTKNYLETPDIKKIKYKRKKIKMVNINDYVTVSFAVKLANASSLLKNAVGSLVSGDISEKGSSLEEIRPLATGENV